MRTAGGEYVDGEWVNRIWLPNNVMAERATVPAVKDLDEFDGFMEAHYEYTMDTGERHYALTNPRDFRRVLDGFACPKCLAKFRESRTDCVLCDWERDLSRDIVEQVPREWLPSAATVTNSEFA